MTCPDGCVIASATDWRTVFRDLAPAGAWVIAIVGWFFVARDQNRRERRKEVRAVVSDLVRDVQSIEAKSHLYLATQGGSPESSTLELQLKSALKRMGLTLQRLRTVEGLGDVSLEFTELRQAITAKDFESHARPPCAPDAQWPYEVSTAVNSLIDALESAFRQRHS